MSPAAKAKLIGQQKANAGFKMRDMQYKISGLSSKYSRFRPGGKK